MKLLFIMLDKPLLVSDEEILEKDFCLMFDDFNNLFLGDRPSQYLGEKAGHKLNKGLRKVIAGLEGQPIVDISNVEKERSLYHGRRFFVEVEDDGKHYFQPDKSKRVNKLNGVYYKPLITNNSIKILKSI